MAGRLEGKITLVTGASKGIGKAVAERFAAEGAKVFMTARGADGELEKSARRILDAGGEAFPIAGDLADEAFVETLFKTAREAFGKLDILVNNAAVPGVGGDVEDLSLERFRQVLEINVVAVFHCMKQAIRIMRANGDKGKIINIGSVRCHWSEMGGPGAYTASKFALRGLTETVARLMIERKSKITIGMVCPGIADTPIHPKSGTSADELRKEWLRPETIAEAVLHSVSAPDNVNVFDTIIFPSGHNVF
jgi:NAD(P)-dependent dehydrogenase (short-subunit alcohol dehydrogenase family)